LFDDVAEAFAAASLILRNAAQTQTSHCSKYFPFADIIVSNDQGVLSFWDAGR
jgi:hypothetical protein